MLRLAPVSYVVPIRSFGVLLSGAVGAWMLGEQITLPRLFAALLVVSGICAIALAG